MSPAALIADPLQGRPIGERMRHALALLFAITWVMGVVVLVTRPSFYPGWFALSANGLLAVLIVVLLAAWRSPAGSLGLVQAVVVVAAAVRIVEAIVLRQPPGDVDYPPMTYVLTMALGATGVVLRPAVGLPLVLANLGALLAERLQIVGVVQSTAEAGYIAAAGLTGFLLVRAVRDELERVEQATSRTQQRRNDALLALERTALRERWDALVHDTVLASLTLAGRGQSTEAATVAADALRELAGPRTSRNDPVAAIAAHAARLGIHVTFHVGEWLPGKPGEALVVATCEALTNVARHSGERTALVTTNWANDVFHVVVADEGRGFDPTEVPERRLGIRRAIQASMRAVGGGAHIQSSPGNGTRVLLHAMPDVGSADPEPGPPWSLASLAWLSVLFALQIASGIVIGGLYLDRQVIPSLSVAGMVLIPAVTMLVAILPKRRPGWPAALIAVVVVWATLLGNVSDLAIIDWRTWFIGSFDSAVVLIALRDRLRRAIYVIVGGTLIGSAVLLIRGSFSAWPIVESTYQTVIWAAIGAYYRRFMDRASAQVAEEAVAQAQARREEQLAAARDDEIRQRGHSLDAEVVPMLRRVAAGEILTDEQRRRCVLLEATTRDQLAAATLLSHELAGAIKSARQRGVTVSIAGRREPETDLSGFHWAASRMLAVARPGDRVQLTWRDTPQERSGTACLVGQGVGARWRSGAVSTGPHLRCDESLDDDSVLLEFASA